MTPFSEAYGANRPGKMDARLVDAHARADNRLAQEATLDRIRLLQECAEFLMRPGPGSGDAKDSGLTMMPQRVARKQEPGKHGQVTTLPFSSMPYTGSNLNFQRTFEFGSERTLVNAVNKGSGLPGDGVAAQYSTVNLSTGELGAMLIVGESTDSLYDYPPVGATQVLGVLEATSQQALLENWIHPGDKSPRYDIGAVATIALPSKAQAWAEPTRNGMFGGLVVSMGDITFEVIACLANGQEVYQRRSGRFLNASASTFGSSGTLALASPVSLGVEVEVPPASVAIIMRITLTLWALRALAEGGSSPSGGLVGAVLADADEDPGHGLTSGQHAGRARVLLSSVVCHE